MFRATRLQGGDGISSHLPRFSALMTSCQNNSPRHLLITPLRLLHAFHLSSESCFICILFSLSSELTPTDE